MGRVNKTINTIFIDIVGDINKTCKYEEFIKHMKSKSSEELKNIINMYIKLVKKNKLNFELLADLEEIIIQIRIRDNIQDIKLSLVKDYIYARTSFYRKNKKAKDIRIIVDKLEFYPEGFSGINILLGNKEFMDKAKHKLIQAMNEEINENIQRYKI